MANEERYEHNHLFQNRQQRPVDPLMVDEHAVDTVDAEVKKRNTFFTNDYSKKITHFSKMMVHVFFRLGPDGENLVADSTKLVFKEGIKIVHADLDNQGVSSEKHIIRSTQFNGVETKHIQTKIYDYLRTPDGKIPIQVNSDLAEASPQEQIMQQINNSNFIRGFNNRIRVTQSDIDMQSGASSRSPQTHFSEIPEEDLIP